MRLCHRGGPWEGSRRRLPRRRTMRNIQIRATAKRIRLVGLLVFAWLVGMIPALAQLPSMTVSRQLEPRTGGFIYYATLWNCDDATMTFSATGDNCRASRRLPLTMELHGSGTRTAVLVVTPNDRSQPFHV